MNIIKKEAEPQIQRTDTENKLLVTSGEGEEGQYRGRGVGGTNY